MFMRPCSRSEGETFVGTPIHDWVRPRLDNLLAEAIGKGMDRDAVVAVMTNIVEGPDYNNGVAPPEDPILTGVSDLAHEEVLDTAMAETDTHFTDGFRAE